MIKALCLKKDPTSREICTGNICRSGWHTRSSALLSWNNLEKSAFFVKGRKGELKNLREWFLKIRCKEGIWSGHEREKTAVIRNDY